MKKFFVLGSDIKYSLSPKIHSQLYSIFGDDAEYGIVDIEGDKLCDIKELCKNSDGFNVTKPFKTEIIKYLSRDLSECGSVNTVTTRDMTGYSTDGDGFIFDLERNFPGASSEPILVIGYGGAALACVTALKKRGAKIWVTGRNAQKAEAFAELTGVETFDLSAKPKGVVSCVTNTFLPLNTNPEFCYDLRYAGETLKLDCPSASGLGMLISQAIYSYGIFTGKQFDNSEVKRVYLKLKENI